MFFEKRTFRDKYLEKADPNEEKIHYSINWTFLKFVYVLIYIFFNLIINNNQTFV